MWKQSREKKVSREKKEDVRFRASSSQFISRPTSWDVILSTIQLLLLERHSERSVHGNINFIIEVIRKYQLNLSRNIRTL